MSSLNKERCDFILKQTEGLFQWIESHDRSGFLEDVRKTGYIIYSAAS